MGEQGPTPNLRGSAVSLVCLPLDAEIQELRSINEDIFLRMLKLDDILLTYSPQTDRIIQISGHMLKQSVMGSDFSYNDIMEDKHDARKHGRIKLSKAPLQQWRSYMSKLIV